MAEPLKREQPSSSVATIFSKEAAQAAVGAPGSHAIVAPAPVLEERPQAQPPAPVRPDLRRFAEPSATGEPADVLRQFQLTGEADKTLKRVMRIYSEATGVDLNRSEFLRAVLHAVAHSLTQHERAARTIGPLRRPKNDKWLLHKRDELERALASALQDGFRAAPPMK